MLIARGRTNEEIASELIVSEATVKTHVNRVLAKLGLRTSPVGGAGLRVRCSEARRLNQAADGVWNAVRSIARRPGPDGAVRIDLHPGTARNFRGRGWRGQGSERGPVPQRKGFARRLEGAYGSLPPR